MKVLTPHFSSKMSYLARCVVEASWLITVLRLDLHKTWLQHPVSINFQMLLLRLEILVANSSFIAESTEVQLNSQTDGFIGMIKQVSWDIICKMYFFSYPLDEQVKYHLK